MVLVGIDAILRELAKNSETRIAVVGAGKKGKELATQLMRKKAPIALFLDNNEKLHGMRNNGVEVERIQNLGENWIYIITVEKIAIRDILEQQLLENNIKKEKIFRYSEKKDYDYYQDVYVRGKCREELSEAYRKEFSRELNWEKPTRYTEILNWEKLNCQTPLKTKLADKIEVRNWVKEKIGSKYLIERYYEWNNVREIDFNKLPKKFVLKLNNGSGRNIIVKDKRSLDIEETKKILAEWFSQNYAFCNGCYELQYKDIEPKIVCEEYLEGVAETVYDYNIYCFHGNPEFIWCIKGSHRPECQASFYDREWNMQPFSFGYPKDPIVAPRPEKLDEMLALSTVLCQGFDHVRVDWYNLPDGRVLFGEMTFTSWSGLRRFVPDEYDDYFGKLILQ